MVPVDRRQRMGESAVHTKEAANRGGLAASARTALSFGRAAIVLRLEQQLGLWPLSSVILINAIEIDATNDAIVRPNEIGLVLLHFVSPRALRPEQVLPPMKPWRLARCGLLVRARPASH